MFNHSVPLKTWQSLVVKYYIVNCLIFLGHFWESSQPMQNLKYILLFIMNCANPPRNFIHKSCEEKRAFYLNSLLLRHHTFCPLSLTILPTFNHLKHLLDAQRVSSGQAGYFYILRCFCWRHSVGSLADSYLPKSDIFPFWF